LVERGEDPGFDLESVLRRSAPCPTEPTPPAPPSSSAPGKKLSQHPDPAFPSKDG